MSDNISDPSVVVYLLHIHGHYYFLYGILRGLELAVFGWYLHYGHFNHLRLTSSCILSIEKLREIINCKTPSEHAFSDTCVLLVIVGELIYSGRL